MRPRDAGFSLVEMVVAMAVMLIVTAGVFAVLDPNQSSVSVQGEAADMQQRLRVAADTLYKDLVMAGAGAYLGGYNTGPLGHYFAPVLPYREGSIVVDPPGTFKTDTISVMYVPSTSAQTTLATSGPGSTSGDISVNADAGCPSGDALCGFRDGMTVLIYGAGGMYDTFTIDGVTPNTLHLQHDGPNLTASDYPPNLTKIVQVRRAAYFLKSDAATETYQLMYSGGGVGSDVPVVDHLVDLKFEYYGEAQPPVRTGTPLTDPMGPWTTYGPPPPPLSVQIPSKGYPAGENCTFLVDGNGQQVPRLSALGASGAPTSLVRLTRAELTDGPWCPDPANANRWDADLLRIRKIVVTIRIESANAALRGPASILFTHGGTSKNGNRWLRDEQTTLQVTPRNLNLGR